MKPINMKTWEVRAILGNRKTVTRRVVKPQPHCYGPSVAYPKHEAKFFFDRNAGWLRCGVCGNFPQYSREGAEVCHFWTPPYRPGDILYVRETFCPYDSDHVINGKRYAYKADLTSESERVRKEYGYKWHPSIHMPREAARIFLRVTGVRVERLWNMTNNDLVNDFGLTMDAIVTVGWKGLGREVWDSTLKPKDRALYGWEANPWVWVVDFERISREEAK